MFSVYAEFQAEKVHELNEEIGKLLAKAEQLGAEGNVDEAQKVLQEVEKVRTKKKDAEVRSLFSIGPLYLNNCELNGAGMILGHQSSQKSLTIHFGFPKDETNQSSLAFARHMKLRCNLGMPNYDEIHSHVTQRCAYVIGTNLYFFYGC